MAEQKKANWAHQQREFDLYRDEPARALLWSMRTGKSRAVIDLAHHLWMHRDVECVVVLAPLGVHDNWVLRQLPEHGSGLDRACAYHYPLRDDPAFQAELHKVTDDRSPLCYLDWLAVGSETLQFKEAVRAIGRFIRGRKFLLVCDESDDYGSPGSKRTRAAKAIARKASYVRILTGTVAEDSPLKVYSQYELLREGALGFTDKGAFDRRYAEYETDYGKGGRRFPRLTGYKNLDELRERMARWSSVVLRSDCPDIPKLLQTERVYRPSKEQLDAYEEMRQRLSVTLDDNVIVTTIEAAARLVKLQQILSGFIVDADGNVHDIPGGNPRLEAVSSEIMLDSGKAIIWCRFREDIRRVAARLRTDGLGVVEYRGGMTSSEKNQSVDRFQKDDSVRVFVGFPVRGLELSAADTIIWYSHMFHAMLRSQADERGTKMGGTATTIVDLIAGGMTGGIDNYILDNLAGKRSVSEDLARGGMKKVLQEVKFASQ